MQCALIQEGQPRADGARTGRSVRRIAFSPSHHDPRRVGDLAHPRAGYQRWADRDGSPRGQRSGRQSRGRSGLGIPHPTTGPCRARPGRRLALTVYADAALGRERWPGQLAGGWPASGAVLPLWRDSAGCSRSRSTGSCSGTVARPGSLHPGRCAREGRMAASCWSRPRVAAPPDMQDTSWRPNSCPECIILIGPVDSQLSPKSGRSSSPGKGTALRA